MSDDSAFIWDQPTSESRARRRQPPRVIVDDTSRITMREAEHQFGVRTSTLRVWARAGSVDAVRAAGPHGEQWMVTPESVAHHLSRRSPRAKPNARRSGPAGDGTSMLVPRDAWDKLMDQLGNLHEAGMQLADARERAAKAETEATFLRERLAEMRTERDAATKATAPPKLQTTQIGDVSWLSRLRTLTRRRGGETKDR